MKTRELSAAISFVQRSFERRFLAFKAEGVA